MLRAEWARWRWRSGTILGRDVVPEVCSTMARSSARAAGRRTWPALRGTTLELCG